jgi:hemoglobin
MGDSHRHLNITPGEWEAFLDDFKQTLDKFKVPAAEQEELFAIVNSTKGDIVIAKPEAAATKPERAPSRGRKSKAPKAKATRH